MDASVFWKVIGNYNSQTVWIQVTGVIVILISAILSYRKILNCAVKVALGLINLYIGIVFFGFYGTEPIQKYFALPLYICCGVLFIYESIRNFNDKLNRPNIAQIVLLILCILYPLISFLLGNRFPQMVTYIMPCPIISISIVIYSGYNRKNKLLLALLAIWGLTGVKSLIFNAYEDIILLICGLFCVYLFFREYKTAKSKK